MKITSRTLVSHYVPKSPHLITPLGQTPKVIPEGQGSMSQLSTEAKNIFDNTLQQPHLIEPASAPRPLLPNNSVALPPSFEEGSKEDSYVGSDSRQNGKVQLHISPKQIITKK